MTKQINSYADLLEEKARLKLLLSAQRELVRQDIIELKQEHRDLDLAIGVLVATPIHDELQLKRLKKRKLLLKDQISFLEGQLTPDIPA